jgi:hypothetical protein
VVGKPERSTDMSALVTVRLNVLLAVCVAVSVTVTV